MFDPAKDLDFGNRPYWMRLGKVTILALGGCMALGLLLLHLAPHS